MRHPSLPLQWQSENKIKRKLPLVWIPWLLHRDSLTARLRQHCQTFSVRVLSQSWQEPRFDEAKILGISRRQLILVREVELLCDNKICIAARSLIPQKTLRGKGWQLRRLKNKPLIEVLAKDPLLKRSDFEIVPLPTEHSDYQRIANHINSLSEKVWQRRSLFYFYGQPVLVSEIFLPGVLDYKKSNN